MRTRMMSMIFLPLALGLVFSGCNGGGSGSVNGGPVVEPPVPTPMQYTVDLMDLPAVIIPADTTIPVGGMMTFGDVTLSCPTGGADCALSQDADGSVTSTGGAATAGYSQAALDRMEEQRRLEAAQQDARIKGLTSAIADPDGDGDPNTPMGGLNKGKRPGRTSFEVMLDPNGVMKIGEDTLEKMDEGVDDQFEPSATEAMRITGWQGSVHERTVDNMQDTLVVYTDVEDPKDVSYMKYLAEGNPASAGVNGRPAIIASIVDGGPDEDDTYKLGRYDAEYDSEGRVNFVNTEPTSDTVTVAEKEASLFSLFTFEKGKETEKKFSGDVVDKKNEFSGTFAGIPGTYICGNAEGCTAHGNTKGRLIELSANWSFQPTETGAQSKVQDVKVDVDYLSYGYWLQETTKPDGSITYGVNTFAAGSMLFAGNSYGDAMAVLEDTATYNGKATGMYAFKEFVDGTGVPTAAGQFQADANLTASFGGNNVAVNDQFTIRGTIDNFVDEAGEDISGGGWSVRLGKSGSFENANEFGGTTTGDGSWNASFYGPQVTDNMATDDMEQKTGYPTGVAGEFNAHLGNGHVIGAFGATQ